MDECGPGLWTFKERHELLRKLASNDDATASEAAALLRHEARAFSNAGRDPADMFPMLTIDLETAIRGARGDDDDES